MGRFTSSNDKGYKEFVTVLADLCQRSETLCQETWTKYNSNHGKFTWNLLMVTVIPNN